MNSLNTVDFLSHLRRSGVQLTTDGQRLRLKAPDGVLTNDLKQEIAGRKAEIITFLGDIRRSQSPTSLQPGPRPPQIPLSSGQEWMWTLEQLEFGGAYNISLALKLQGLLDIDSLNQALTEIVRRHESLRTTFATDEGVSYQIIQPKTAVELRRIDLQSSLPEQQESQVKQRAKEESLRPFNLTEDLLLRATLFSLSEDTSILLLVVHHIASDAWSQKIMSQELATLYTAFSQGQPSPLPDLAWQYADFALWQRDWLQEERVEAQRAYWHQQLAELPPLLQLPTDRPRPQVPSFRNRTYRFTLEADLIQSLRQLNRQTGTTLFMTALAAFQILLARYTGQKDIAVGTLMADRPRPEFEPLIGLFINTLALRVNLSGNPTVTEVLEQVKSVTQAAYSHRNLPFERLIEDLQPVRQFTYHPIVQNFLRLVDMAGVELTLPDLRVSPLAIDDERVGLPDLDLLLVELEDRLEGACLYNIDLFDEATIERLIGHYQTLLAGMIDNPQQTVYELPLLTHAEQHQLLVEWNGRQTKFPHPQDQCVHQLFERQVEQTPEALAVVFKGETTGRQALTYRQLNQRANQLAHYLQAAGVGPGSRVGLCMERSLEMVIGLLGTLKAGAAYIPLDPAYPENRLKLMIDDSQLAVLLTQSQVVTPTLPPSVQVIRLDQSEANLQAYPNHNPTARVSGDDWVYVIYTSGSTGQPKGAGVYHRGFTNLVQWYVQDLAMTASERMLLISALSFDLTQKNIFAPLICGGQLILTDALIFDPSEICEAIQKHAITWVNCTPSMFYHLVDQDLQTQQSQLASLRYAVLGGEPITMARLANWLARPEIKTKIVNSYGPTECSDVCAAYVIEEPKRFMDQAIPIGQPLPNVQLYVLDPHHQMVPVGHTGELCIAGVGVGAGYLNRPQLTATKFITNPFAAPAVQNHQPARPSALLYKTGDLVRWRADGQIEFVGRVDHQVKLRGFRIELGEIEASLEEHPAVREAVVMVRENQQGDQRLTAYVVTASHASTVDATELRPFLAERLPDYMVPALFFPLKSLPLTPSGKVDRKALASQETVAEPEPAAASNLSPFEQKMMALWSELLEQEEVSVADSFFALGGDSFLALRLIARLKEIGIDLTFRQFFEQPTIAGLVERLKAVQPELLQRPDSIDTPIDKQGGQYQTPDGQLRLQPIPRTGPLPLSFAQQRVWFLDQLEDAVTPYNEVGAVTLHGSLDIDIFEQAMLALLRRHETLRTIFIEAEGQPTQVVGEPNLSLTVVDLQTLPIEAQESRLQQIALQEAQTPFNLGTGPLLRLTLFKRSTDHHVLLLVMHHICGDLWSSRILIQEFATLYSAFLNNQPSPLPPLPIQYADFAWWQRQWLQGDVLDRQLDYWHRQLAGAPTVLALPTDRPRPAHQTFAGRRLTFEIDLELTRQLRSLSGQNQATLFMTCLAAFNILLARYSGQQDIVIGSPIANRRYREVEPLIGFFVNTLVLRTDLTGNPTFLELLERVRRMTQTAYDHQDLPFEKVIEALNPERTLSHAPLFQVMFAFQNIPAQAIELPQLKMTEYSVESGYVKFDLEVELYESPSGLQGIIEYSTDLFEAATMERFVGHYCTLLKSIVAAPDQAIADLSLLTVAERHQILVEWNDTKLEYPQDECIHHLFEAQVQRTPEAVAVVFEGQQLTYRELNQQANQLAHYLISLGVGPDKLVGLCVDRSPQMVIGLLGILKAGGTYIPLDPAFPRQRLTTILQDSGMTTLVTQHKFVGHLPEQPTQTIYLDTDWLVIAAHAVDNIASLVTPNQLAYIIYTSGSTGKPKGVRISHRAVVNFLTAMQQQPGISADDKLLAVTTLSFDIAVLELFLPLTVGAQVSLVEHETAHDGRLLGQALTAHQATVMQATPATWQMLLESGWPGDKRLKALCGGEALPRQLADQLLTKVGELWNMYGPTETTIWSALYPITAGQGAVPIGRPIANTQLYILDAYLQPVPIGVPGDLYISGDGLAQGYHHRPELTKEKFIDHPVVPGTPLYHTGDVARWRSDGTIEYLGRLDHQVKLRGFRIELGEIEAVLSRHPRVENCVVLAREDTPGDKRLVAYVVARPTIAGEDASVEAENQALALELRQYLKQQLPDYMIPSAFVRLNSLPLTPNGKIDHKVLPTPEWQATTAYVAPQTATQESLIQIWTEVLHVEQMGIDDDFFELGGHSLLATQLVTHIRDELHVSVPLRDLFVWPTVAGLAKRIETLRTDVPAPPAALPELIPIPEMRYKPFPLTEVQRAYWLGRSEAFELGRVATHAYVEVEGTALDLARLEGAWQRLIERHEILRAVILPDGRQQVLADVPPYAIKIYDLSEQDEVTRDTQLEAIRAEMAHQVLPAEQWPLFDLRASRLTGERTRLHFSFDMLIGDAWSMVLLFREWQTLYHRPETVLPKWEITFRDYVLAEQALAETQLFEQSEAYWFNRLDSLPSAPQLPLAQDPAAIEQPRFKRYQGRLAVETWQALKSRAKQAGLSPSGVLLAAFSEVLATWSKSTHFILNLTLFNRLPLHPQVNALVGDFTSLTLLEVDNRQAESLAQRARRLQQQLWQDLDHRYVGGVRVLQELSRRQGDQVFSPVVFTSILGLENLDGTGFDLSAWGDLEPVYSISQTPQVWLDHQVSEEQGHLTYNWDVVEGLFPPGLIEAMLEAYETLLVRLVEDETTWQRADQTLTPATQLAQRAAVNDTTAPVAKPLLHTLFAERVAQQPEAVAVISPDRQLTYRQLFELSNRIGHFVRQSEIEPVRLVAVVMDKGWEQVAAVLGILAGGGAYLPIAPTLPDERRHFLLQEGEVSLAALTQQHLADTLTWPEGVRTLVVDSDDLVDVDSSPLPVIQQPTDLAYVIYTSGSTGLPKGVMIDHRGAVNTLLDLNDRFAIGSNDRVLALSNLNFDLSVYDIFGTLAAGGTIVMPEAERRIDPAHWLTLIRDHQVTLWNSVPALMQMLVDYLGSAAERAELESLRLVWLSGDWIPVTLPEQIKAVWPKLQLISMGGATEASIWSILYPIETVNPTWSSIPYGQPMRNQSWQVLNERLEPCPIWVPGELYIGGIGLAQGYWRDEDKTNARFIIHPTTEERLYKTGDLGRYLPDGNIEFLGREDFQVKIRGHRIELGEIEAALRQHPAVKEAVVSTVGELRESKQLAAYLVPTNQADNGHGPEPGLLDPAARLDFKLKQPGLRRLDGEQHFDLFQPGDDTPWRKAFLHRQSYRHFQAKPITAEQFGRWLKCLGQVTFEESPLPKYGYPSAGNLYPVQTYLYLKPDHIMGLAGGFYYYHPAQHRLIQLAPTDDAVGRLFPDFNQPIFDQAAFAVFLVAQLEAMTPMYGSLSRDFCLLEAGYMSQSLMLEAPHYQMGLCPIGVLNDPNLLHQRLHLNENHLILHTLLGGQIEPSQSQQLPTSPAKPKTTGWQDQLQAYLVEKLPDYMVPAHFVILPKLPLTANGKIDRRALPAPNVRNSFEQEFVAPRTPFEIAVAAIWADLLELHQVSIHDDFFEVGGDSLLATRLVTRIRDEFRIELPLRSLFEWPTVAGLADRIEAIDRGLQRLQSLPDQDEEEREEILL